MKALPPPTRFEIDREQASLREQILNAREHAGRTTGAIREANRACLRDAVQALVAFNQQLRQQKLAA